MPSVSLIGSVGVSAKDDQSALSVLWEAKNLNFFSGG